ncbi:MAG: MgtC/SapB family protein [Patescibacteria group bacterium]
MTLPLQEIVLRLLVATVLSGIIGIEREIHRKPAGVRTNALIGLGAAAMTLCGLTIATSWAISSDPTRIASIVVQGIGFLGAGAIIQARGTVRGLTTAASMWVVSGIGIACGFGFYEIAIVASIFALILLVIFGPIDYRLMGEAEGGEGLMKKFLNKKEK